MAVAAAMAATKGGGAGRHEGTLLAPLPGEGTVKGAARAAAMGMSPCLWANFSLAAICFFHLVRRF